MNQLHQWFQRLSVATLISVMATSTALAGRLPDPSRHGSLPEAAETTLTGSFRCLGQAIEASDRQAVLFVLRGFQDGTVPFGYNGPLNDTSVLLAEAAVAALGTQKVLAVVDERRDRAFASDVAKDRLIITIEAQFTAYDQRTMDASRSADLFLFNLVQTQRATDISQSALHLTSVMKEVDDIIMPGTGLRLKAILQNDGQRSSFSIFTDDNDLNLAFQRASFQGLGDAEALLIELTILTAVQRLYGIDVASCLNRPFGADHQASNELMFERLSRREIEDATIGMLFLSGYLERPLRTFDGPAIQGLRRFQADNGLPPDGRPNTQSFRILREASARTMSTMTVRNRDAMDFHVGRILESAQSGSRTEWRQDPVKGSVVVSGSATQHEGRPCRRYSHQIEINGRTYEARDQVGCRLYPNVWVTLP